MDVQTKNRILALLDQVTRYTHRFIDNDGRISKIEMDTLLGYMRDLYDKTLDVGREAEYPVDKKQSPTTGLKEQAQATKEEKVNSNGDSKEFEELKKNIESLKKQFEKMDQESPEKKDSEAQIQDSEKKQTPDPTPEAHKPQEQTQEKQPPKMDDEKSPEKAHGEPKHRPPERERSKEKEDAPPPSPKSLGESFSEKKSSLYDTLSQSSGENTIGEQMKRHRLDDLKSAIDISHKFLFINELFDGNASEYHETIEQLNNADSIRDASDILAEKRDKYNWDDKEGTFRIFNDLVHRKFQ